MWAGPHPIRADGCSCPLSPTVICPCVSVSIGERARVRGHRRWAISVSPPHPRGYCPRLLPAAAESITGGLVRQFASILRAGDSANPKWWLRLPPFARPQTRFYPVQRIQDGECGHIDDRWEQPLARRFGISLPDIITSMNKARSNIVTFMFSYTEATKYK